MTTLMRRNELTPFDILFRDFFNTNDPFSSVFDARIKYPLNIFEDEAGLHFEIACTGLTKKDVEISIEGDTLKIKHSNTETVDEGENSDKNINYIHRGIARRSFDLGYKISSKFDLSKANATMENGLLAIDIPFAAEAKTKLLPIK